VACRAKRFSKGGSSAVDERAWVSANFGCAHDLAIDDQRSIGVGSAYVNAENR